MWVILISDSFYMIFKLQIFEHGLFLKSKEMLII
jgi:hypothetical protein